jgi:hypothetical protein
VLEQRRRVLHHDFAMKLGNDPPDLLVLTPLESLVLQAAGQSLGSESAPAFAAQVAQVRVVSRSHSGVGFVTRLGVPAGAPGLHAQRMETVRASHPQLREPAEFLVQLRDGRLATLEAFCPEGMWPADESAFRIKPVARQ